MILRPKNWATFQHYKNRNPPWIRLHRDLLDNYEFQCLPVASKALAPMLWLLASGSTSGEFDATPQKLAFRLRMTENEVEKALKPLIDNGFFEHASKVLAECKQVAPKNVPETETETETETEKDNAPRKRSASSLLPDVDDQTLTDWIAVRKAKRAGPITATVAEALYREAKLANLSAQEAVRTAVERGWQGFRADWLTKTPPRPDLGPSRGSAAAGVAETNEYLAAQAAHKAVPPPPEIMEKLRGALKVVG